MAAFAWNESYSVHVGKLDAQHQKLFEIINTLADAMRAGQGGDVIREVVGNLAVYTRTHFLQEEVLMQQTGYPGYEAHRRLHAELMGDVEKYKAALDEGRPADSVAVLNFLRRWLVDHIQKADKAYSAHMVARGVH